MLVIEPSGRDLRVAYVPASYESYRFSCASAMRRHFRAIGDLVAQDEIVAATIASMDFEAIRSEIEEG